MAMNIKNQEAYELAQFLAREEGKSITQVVLEALRDRKEKMDRKRRNSQVRAAIRDLQGSLKGQKLSVEELYDAKTGLPK